MRLIATICVSLSLSVSIVLTPTRFAHAAPPPLELNVRSAILIDVATGAVLYEKDADTRIPPASLTKMMTLHMAYRQLESGAMKPTDMVQIRTEAWARNMPGSSVMFLEPGERVTVQEILKGIAVSSGNDASIAMAQHISGSVDAFVAAMNKEAKDLGFTTMNFADPHGLSPQSMITAREFAEFARLYIDSHPKALADLHSIKEFAYPLWENLSDEGLRGKTKETHQPIAQPNRNGLLWSFEGTDGLKTGFIDESGFNIALTAKRGDMRLIAVVLGAPGRTIDEGTTNRETAGAAILSWGFQNFATVRPEVGEFRPIRVWKGEGNEVALTPAYTPILTVAKGLEDKITRTVHQEDMAVAPIKKGAKLGDLIYAADGAEIARIPLLATDEVEQGGFFKRIWDSVRLTVSSWFAKK